MKQPAVYFMSNRKDGVIYIGVTSDLPKRVFEHKNKITGGFTKKYNCSTLVYFELFEDMETAILREKQLKAGSRIKKVELINSQNPNWEDLWKQIS